MVIPRGVIARYNQALTDISDAVKAQLVQRLYELDWDRPVAEVRSDIEVVMQATCGASAEASARLAADFYDGISALYATEREAVEARRMANEQYRAKVESMRDPKATDGAVRAFVQDLVDGKGPDAVIEQCAQRLDYESRRAANMCTYTNLRNDPRKPKWARVPTGPETCMFCIMLASRGFAYHSEDSASHVHANCDCRIVPGFDGATSVAGYDPAYYEDVYRHPDEHPEVQEAINARRRELRDIRRDEAAGVLPDGE